MNILITGANGQLGKDCQTVFGGSHTMTCVDIEELDITRADDVLTFVRDIQPEVIINCAAFTQVDRCETEQDLARAVNVSGAENLARGAAECGALMVHISTDYVFDGEKNFPETYDETDDTGPQSVYGRTKLEGEQAVMSCTDNHLVLRTAWLYGFNGHNFIKAILKKTLSDPEKPVKVVNDQFGTPTWSMALACQIEELLAPPARGLYHASAEGACTWYAFARYFLERLGVPHRLIPCTTAEYPTPAKRPRCAILENHRLKVENRNRMEHWQSALDNYINQYGPALLDECRPTSQATEKT
jgi:dTDP-4-dehydrorhamnose reductase